MGETGRASMATASMQLAESVRQRIPDDLAAAIDFHGHFCPGLTIGYRAAVIAMDRLGVQRGSDEQLLGIVETDACGVDAFQFMTGCTLGKGNLIYKDYGKQAFTLVRRSDGRAIRVVLRPNGLQSDDAAEKLRRLVATGEASAAEQTAFWDGHINKALRLLDEPEELFGAVSEVEVDVPPAAQHFSSVICAVCGEAVMEPRSRLRDGEPCCIPCSNSYGRAWEING